jgi:Ca2+-binding EF-hand superfamily protein
LRTLFDRKCLKQYQDRFDQHDPEQSGRIAKSKIIDVVEDLCSSGSSTKHAESTTVRKHLSEWFRSQDALRTHSKFDFKTLVVAHAVAAHHLSTLKIQQNMSNTLEARFASHHESKKQLELWQRKIGFRTFETLQRFFHDCAIPRMYPARVRVSEIASIFDQVTRSAVPNKPLEVYLQQMQLRAHHTLQLAEFMCCYYQLYGSADTSRVPVWTEQLELRPIAFVAACLFSNGDSCCHRHGDLVRRLCIGRTPAQVDLIMRFREVFESLQAQDNSDGDSTISTSQLDAFAAKVVGDPSSLDQPILALRKRTAAVSLVEIFSTCGFVIDELTSAPTVANAINKMRLRTETAEVRRLIGLVRNMCLKVLRFPNNSDFWRVRSDSAAFHQKIGRFDGATSLIEAVGFIEYGKSHFELRGARTPEGNRSSCLPKATLDTLREKCSELDAELSVIDGVESVVSILQRIAKQREHDTPLSLDECEDILKYLVVYVETVLKNPKDSRCWRIRESNKTFQRQVGYLPFCADLMASIGYDLASSSQGNVYVLRGTGLGTGNASGEKVDGKVIVNASLSNFAFSNVSQQMEWFLWRRKQEIESLLQDDMEYLVQVLAPSTSASTTRHPYNIFQRSAGTPATGKMYPYGRNALDTFNKSASQNAQLAMMQALFESLDKKKQGYLVAEDLHVHCKLGMTWASFEMFDLDADERVDFPDFVGALGPCLDYSFDPLSRSDFVSFQRMALSEQVSTLVGRILLTVYRTEAARVLESVVGFLMRIIDQPSKAELRTISNKAAIVAQSTRVQPLKELLQLAGYRVSERQASSNDADDVAFVLHPHQQVRFQTSKTSRLEVAPLDSQTLSRLQLIAAMLAGHCRVVMLPTISNIGALGRAIGERRPIPEWIKLLELLVMCLDNIVKHPEDEDRYRQLKKTTATFSSVVSNICGGVQLFLMIGFRETGRGTLLLPDDVGHDEIQARKLEISVGCEVLRIKEKLSHVRVADDNPPPPASLRRAISDGTSSPIDPAVDYYKRKALAAELAREEAVQKSANLEKQLKMVASTQQSRRPLTSAPLMPSSKSRYTRKRDGRRQEFH